MTGDGMAMVYENLEKSLNELVCGTIALSGQMRTHSPQSMQRSRSSDARRFLTLMAWVGHTRMQAILPWHRSSSIRMDGKASRMT
jgi:hypothetical protein